MTQEEVVERWTDRQTILSRHFSHPWLGRPKLGAGPELQITNLPDKGIPVRHLPLLLPDLPRPPR